MLQWRRNGGEPQAGAAVSFPGRLTGTSIQGTQPPGDTADHIGRPVLAGYFVPGGRRLCASRITKETQAFLLPTVIRRANTNAASGSMSKSASAPSG